jgi:hypothetical protein
LITGRTNRGLYLVAIAVLFGVTSAAAQTVLDGNFPERPDVTLDKVHAAISAEFLDPGSAQYKGLILRNEAYKPSICGLVNAKNSAGGYTPFYPFAYAIDSGKAYVGVGFGDDLMGDMVETTLEIMGCPPSSVGLQ